MTYGKMKELYETGFMSKSDFIFEVEMLLDNLDLENEEDKERYDLIKSDFEEMFR